MSCPICSKPVVAAYRPFCSRRCADLDLAKWLGEGYAIPSNDPEDFDKLADAMEEALDREQRDDQDKLH